MRVGELTGLQWENVDFNNHTIDVNHTLAYFDTSDRSFDYEIHTTKTAAGFRTISMIDNAYEVLQKQKALNKVCSANINGYDDFVFVNRFHNVYNQSTLNRALRRICADANEDAVLNGKVELRKFSCHSLRHTFCTNLIRAGVDVKRVQYLMGHADIETSLGIYADVTEDMRADAGESLNEYMNKMKSTKSTNLATNSSTDNSTFAKGAF